MSDNDDKLIQLCVFSSSEREALVMPSTELVEFIKTRDVLETSNLPALRLDRNEELWVVREVADFTLWRVRCEAAFPRFMEALAQWHRETRGRFTGTDEQAAPYYFEWFTRTFQTNPSAFREWHPPIERSWGRPESSFDDFEQSFKTSGTLDADAILRAMNTTKPKKPGVCPWKLSSLIAELMKLPKVLQGVSHPALKEVMQAWKLELHRQAVKAGTAALHTPGRRKIVI